MRLKCRSMAVPKLKIVFVTVHEWPTTVSAQTGLSLEVMRPDQSLKQKTERAGSLRETPLRWTLMPRLAQKAFQMRR